MEADDDLSIEDTLLEGWLDPSPSTSISIESVVGSATSGGGPPTSAWLSQPVDQRWKQLVAFGGPSAVQKYWLTGPPVAKYLPRAAIKFQKKV